MTSLKKNFIYNLIYQVFSFITPLMTAPYISRVLNPKGVGIYSYTSSIVTFFSLFTMLGIVNHGSRSIASSTKNKFELGKIFWSNYIIQFVMGVIISLCYVTYYVTSIKKNQLIFLIQSLVIISSILDINWFFFGLEKFKLTVSRNLFCKMVTIVFIFIFVKSSSDLWKYTLIMSGSLVISQVILWRFLFFEIDFVKPTYKNIIQNLKPLFFLFLPVLSYSFYRIISKIMIGKFSSMIEVGYYENAEKILNIPISIVTALGSVMLPRISNLIQVKEIDLQKKYFNKCFLFVSFLECGMCFGIAAISPVFVPFFFGKEFYNTSAVLSIIIFSALISGWANVIRTQYLIPRKKDETYVASMIVAALLNVTLNLLFIPSFGALGATIGAIAAELSILIIQMNALKKAVSIREIIEKNYIFLIIGFLMFTFVRFLDSKLEVEVFLKIIIEITFGCFFYIVLLTLYFIFFRKNKISSILKKHKL